MLEHSHNKRVITCSAKLDVASMKCKPCSLVSLSTTSREFKYEVHLRLPLFRIQVEVSIFRHSYQQNTILSKTQNVIQI